MLPESVVACNASILTDFDFALCPPRKPFLPVIYSQHTPFIMDVNIRHRGDIAKLLSRLLAMMMMVMLASSPSSTCQTYIPTTYIHNILTFVIISGPSGHDNQGRAGACLLLLSPGKVPSIGKCRNGFDLLIALLQILYRLLSPTYYAHHDI